MAGLDNKQHISMLTEPRETLSIEYKSWLELSSNHGKATLAKAAIALANYGGGTIVVGMREDESDEATPVSNPRPSDIARYDISQVNAAINRFADPKLNCEVKFAIHPVTNVEHVIVNIPENVSVPVMSTRDSGDVINQQTCYIRKPGPKSEPPYTSEEWRELLNRCVRSSREELLESIRAIVMGNVQPASTDSNETERLLDFKRKSHERWQELTADLPDDNPARFPNGYFEVAFSIANLAQPPSLTQLRNMLRDGPAATRGWPPFISLSSIVFQPKVIKGAIENWLGDPDGEKFFRDEYSLLFWRAHPDGYFYQIEGYLEDGSLLRLEPGTVLYPDFIVMRFSHFLLHAQDLSSKLANGANIVIACRFTGLKHRKLKGSPTHPINRDHKSHEESYSFELEISESQIRNNLVEVVFQQLRPLYEQFDFYELKHSFVSDMLKS